MKKTQQSTRTVVRPGQVDVTKDPAETILVLGGTGKTGRRVVERLTNLGCPLKVGSRSVAPYFDWLDTSTWRPALRGVDSVYISYHPDVAIPGAVDAVRELTKVAKATGVKHLVLLSGRGEKEAQGCEEIVMASGVEWTILRASWFSQNFSEGFFLEPLQAGHFTLPAGDVGEPFIDVDDIADVAVAALTEKGHAGQLYELTGPRMLTFREVVGEIANATGRKIQYEQVTVDDYVAMLNEYGVPKDYIWLVTYLFSEVLDGRNERITDGVQRALGRKPTDFSEYIRKTVPTGVWG